MAEFLSLVEDFIAAPDDTPPSYTDATSSTSTSSFRPPNTSSTPILPPSLTNPITSSLTTHLTTLPVRLRAAQEAQANSQAQRDLDTITALVPAIECFLADLGTTSSLRPGSAAELTLVPASAVPKGWALSDAAERRREGEIVRIFRVETPSASPNKLELDSKGGGKKGAPNHDDHDDDGEGYTTTGSRSAGFDEWGRFTDSDEMDGTLSDADVGAGTFFRDERMARRLATYLQPRAEVKAERRQVHQEVVDAKKERGVGGLKLGWGKKKSESSDSSQPLQAAEPVKGPVVQTDDRVSMTVKAQEVAFRKENDLGVWESRSGYGIVVSIRLKKP